STIKSGDGMNGAVGGVFVGGYDAGSRMASESCTRAIIGRGTSTADEPGARRHFFAPGAFCARIKKTTSEKRRVARPRDQFARARLCAHLKKTSQCYGERHD